MLQGGGAHAPDGEAHHEGLEGTQLRRDAPSGSQCSGFLPSATVPLYSATALEFCVALLLVLVPLFLRLFLLIILLFR